MVKQNVGYLIIEHPDGRTQEVLIPANSEFTVGRHKRNDIIVDRANVSRCHILFKSWDSSVHAVVASAVNLTLLNGSELHTEAKLESGDVLVIGETSFRYYDIDPYGTGRRGLTT